jgi:histidinol-phosphate/aromatic aminotransferase/cobyric acid decarboxylase-like protein
MRFPLADWIDEHADCRYDLATSGMRGSVPAPPWPAKRPPYRVLSELHAELSDHLGVDPGRLSIAHGASEANGWVLRFLRQGLGDAARAPAVRVRYPEYPPLFDVARGEGFRVVGDGKPAEVAVVSRPRNPEGDLWTEDGLARFARGTRHLLVDETFREFANVPSVAARAEPGVWATGSFTKFFGADEARVGFAVAPPGTEGRFARYVGVVSDEVAPASAAMALALLRDLARVRRAVRRVFDRNLSAFRAAYPGSAVPVGPMFFDRVPRSGGRALAQRCLRASVLVCPGDLFGDRRGVRVTMTRREFPRGLAAYLAVRGRPLPGSAGQPRVGPLDRAPGSSS